MLCLWVFVVLRFPAFSTNIVVVLLKVQIKAVPMQSICSAACYVYCSFLVLVAIIYLEVGIVFASSRTHHLHISCFLHQYAAIHVRRSQQ